jgi:hypothetical protein
MSSVSGNIIIQTGEFDNDDNGKLQ